MPDSPGFRSIVVDSKARLRDGRQALSAAHDQGQSGVHVCAEMTRLTESILLDVFESAKSELPASGARKFADDVCLIVHGGVGRGEMAPYSDVDLMLLHELGADEDVAFLARRLTQDLYDIGYQLGFSLRNSRETFQLMAQDATVFTSLCEARLMAGNETLYSRFQARFDQMIRRRTQFLIEATEQARKEERVKYGETVFLLRPNVKRSRGALRDIHLVRWIARTRYGIRDFDRLAEKEVLTAADHQVLVEAREFLLRLRNELHFGANKSQDSLGRREQVRIAEKFGYEGREGVLPVESFMSDYFRHTSDVRYSSAHFVASARTRSTIVSIVGPIFSVSFEGDFRVGPINVGATRQGMEKVTRNLVDVLRLMELANAFNRRIDHPTWEAIREAMMHRASIDLTADASRRFMALLAEPTRLADLLRRLHEMRVLEKILPAFRHTRGLLQFNEYHKYTVDEHSLRAVEFAARCLHDDTVLGETYRSIKQKGILHLALLLHDAGKGYSEDHSELGRKIAAETALRLRLSEHETEMVMFLVHKHLFMSHLAFRRNLDDDAVIAQFAAEVGSLEILKMLYVLTCADLAAVGPDVLNDWKLSLLGEMYQRTRDQLAGEYSGSRLSPRLMQVVNHIHQSDYPASDRSWLDETVRRLPASYLSHWTVQQLLETLLVARDLKSESAEVWCRYLEQAKSVELTLVAQDRPQSGHFHRLTGELTSRGMEILSADVTTIGKTLVVIRFVVNDKDHAGKPPQERFDEIRSRLMALISATESAPPTFRTLWSDRQNERKADLSQQPIRVRIDNDSSERHTLIDVFANDRTGLLYQITQAIFHLGLEIRVAKIGTYLDQVVDAFYVTDELGGKITDEGRLKQVCERLERTACQSSDSQ